MNRSFTLAILAILMVISMLIAGCSSPSSEDDKDDKKEGAGDVFRGSNTARIHMDGKFPDWASVPVVYSDSIEDHDKDGLDFGDLKIANDENLLFIYIELNKEIVLQEKPYLKMYIDADNDASTGSSQNGLGAELAWSFGDRKGSYYSQSGTITVWDEDLGLLTAPTVSSDTFEIALDINSKMNGDLLFSWTEIAIAFSDISGGSDTIPAEKDTIVYSFDTSPLEPLEKIPITKSPGSDLRLVSYNVLRDNLFEPALFDAYDRILTALDPDIIGFVEIYDHDASETADIVERILPSGNGSKWYAMKRFPDIVLVSRYPINASYSIDSNGAFLLDIGPDEQLLVIVAHLPSGDKNFERQEEIDNIMAFVTDAKISGGDLDLAADTPIIIMGDMNLVGDSKQLRTFVTEGYDWDGGGFADLKPRHTHAPLYFTWYSEESSFWPGRLDFIFYSDSVLTSLNGFVLFTRYLPDELLNGHGLEQGDTEKASDHLPLVMDLSMNV
jgi:endonuclease/exonuclease/phosphatase family metal-dependent hydrolase